MLLSLTHPGVQLIQRQTHLAGSPANILDVVGFVHDGESILDTPMHSWIQDPLVIDQQWIQAP